MSDNGSGKLKIVLGASLAFLAGIMLINKMKGTKKETLVKSEQNESNNGEKQQQIKFFDKIKQIREHLPTKGQDILTPQVVTLILIARYQLAREQIKMLIRKFRIQRRQKIQQPIQFANLVLKHQMEQQALQSKHLNAILSQFDIDLPRWVEAFDSLSNNSDFNNQDLVTKLQSEQRLSLNRGKSSEKDFKTLTNVLNYKYQQLQKLNVEQLGIQPSIGQAQIFIIVQAYLNDLTYQKYGVEEQDIEYSYQLLNQEQKNTIKQLENKYFQKVRHLGSQQHKQNDQQ